MFGLTSGAQKGPDFCCHLHVCTSAVGLRSGNGLMQPRSFRSGDVITCLPRWHPLTPAGPIQRQPRNTPTEYYYSISTHALPKRL